jgi:Flp pilus assembly protein CpaB
MRRGRVLILLGLILAVGTAAIVFWVLSGVGGEGGPAEVATEEVVVAIQPIAEDEPVEGRVDLVQMAVDAIPPGAVRSIEETAGMLAAGPIPQGTVIQPDLLISPQDRMRQGELGKLVEVGFVAVGLPIDELSSVSYGIQPGDHVDILMTLSFVDVDLDKQVKEPICPFICEGPPGATEGELVQIDSSGQFPRLVSQLTVQNAEVLGVGRWSYEPAPLTEEEQQQARTQQGEVPPAEEPPDYITLMLSPQDALVVKLAREYNASIDLAVRAQDDGQPFATDQVTLQYIMARYGISLPDKQTYTIDQMVPLRPEAEEGQ